MRLALPAGWPQGHPYAEAIKRLSGWDGVPAIVAEGASAHLRSVLQARGNFPKVESIEIYPEQGVSALVDGRRVLVGSMAWLEENGIEPSAETRMHLQNRPELLLGVGVNARLAGILFFLDSLLLRAGRRVSAPLLEPHWLLRRLNP